MKNGRVGKAIKLVATLYTPASIIFHSEAGIYVSISLFRIYWVPHFSNENFIVSCKERRASLLLRVRKKPYETFSRFNIAKTSFFFVLTIDNEVNLV